MLTEDAISKRGIEPASPELSMVDLKFYTYKANRNVSKISSQAWALAFSFKEFQLSKTAKQHGTSSTDTSMRKHCLGRVNLFKFYFLRNIVHHDFSANVQKQQQRQNYVQLCRIMLHLLQTTTLKYNKKQQIVQHWNNPAQISIMCSFF